MRAMLETLPRVWSMDRMAERSVVVDGGGGRPFGCATTEEEERREEDVDGRR